MGGGEKRPKWVAAAGEGGRRRSVEGVNGAAAGRKAWRGDPGAPVALAGWLEITRQGGGRAGDEAGSCGEENLERGGEGKKI